MPRSPSRDLADRYSGNRAYFHRLDGSQRAKAWLALLALGAVLCWALFELASPARTAPMHSHGELASVHAAWEQDCNACHVAHGLDGSVFAARDRWHDLTCQKCHSGPAHHASIAAEGQAFHDRCSNCHHDHGGRNSSLVRITDDHCTRCHQDVAAHTSALAPVQCERSVTDFVQNHPEFKPLTGEVQRTLKFSHALHMTPGIKTNASAAPFTLEALAKLTDSATTARYRQPDQVMTDAVRLDCASCHQLDAGSAASAGTSLPSGRSRGDYYLPVIFDTNCKACHPLRAPEVVLNTELRAGFALPHGQQPAELQKFLLGEFSRQLLTAGQKTPEAPVRLDGRGEAESLAFRQAIDKRTRDTMMRLFEVSDHSGVSRGEACTKCHDLSGNSRDFATLRIAPVPPRAVWFTKARFDHTVHRASTCATCHPGTAAAFTAPGKLLVEKEPPQIAGIDTCRACHSPAGTSVALADGTTIRGGGVRHQCTDCHAYHNGDHPREGRAAPARLPAKPLDLKSFLRGTNP